MERTEDGSARRIGSAFFSKFDIQVITKDTGQISLPTELRVDSLTVSSCHCSRRVSRQRESNLRMLL